jgi:DNA polymerase-1
MFNLTLSEESEYPFVFLVPTIRKEDMVKEYVDQFNIPHSDVLFLTLHTAQGKKKTPAEEMKRYVAELLVPALHDVKAKYIAVADSEYFKLLTKSAKVEAHLGYVMDCVFGPWKVVYVPNYRQIFYDPDKTRQKIKQGIEAVIAHASGQYSAPGTGIIQFQEYPKTYAEIAAWLDKLLKMDCDLTIDIEAFSLKHHSSGIGSISFAWNKYEGISFLVDYTEIPEAIEAPFGKQIINNAVRKLLINFFLNFKKKAIYHNIGYDGTVLIYQLFMMDIIDTEGLLYGIEVMTKNWEDTKLITYLATNSCAGNKLGLKDQAQEYAGNYAQEEIKDITKIPATQLLQYNLVDSLSTWFVYEKHWDTMVADNQLEIYETLFKPSMVDIIQMQLTGLPLNMNQVKKVKAELTAIEEKAKNIIQGTAVIKQFTYRMNEEWVTWKNSTLKKKRVTLADAKEVFNPNSGPQLQDLLFNMLGLPIISLTDTKQPSTDGDTLRALVNHTKDPDILSFLNAMLEYGAVNKILTSFIPAFEKAALGPDGWYYLFGFFNLGGTLSGRLSSSDPNLQNLPSTNTKMEINKIIVKLIKSCFEAPPGWLFTGLDFASLEDKISAVTTKDPNKLKVYLETQTYKLVVDSVIYHIDQDTPISYDGTIYTGKSFYEKFNTNGFL